MKRTTIAAAFLALFSLAPGVSHADFARICRGASLFRYDNQIKQALQQKLTDAGIAFKRVEVSYTQIKRPHDKYVDDFASDLTIGTGDTPQVTFTGAFPDLTPCTVTLNVRIAVVYPNGTKIVTFSPVTAPGTLLPALSKASNVDE
jgi:hypothetical protein